MGQDNTESLQYQVFCEMDELVYNRLRDEYDEGLPSWNWHEDIAADCDAFLNRYKENLIAAKGNSQKVLSAIKKVTLAFNAFDARYQYPRLLHCFMFFGEEIPSGEMTFSLAIRQIILQSAVNAGVGDGEEDLTEEWRLW